MEISNTLSLLERFSSVKLLRDLYLDIIFGNKQGELYAVGSGNSAWPATNVESVPVAPTELKNNHFYCSNLAYQVCLLLSAGRGEEPLDLQVMRQDLARVPLQIAIVAWLSTDQFRWSDDYPHFEEEYSDLSYGLVTSFPEGVLAYATFTLGFRFIFRGDSSYYFGSGDQEEIFNACAELAREMFFLIPKETRDFCWQAALLSPDNLESLS